MQQKIIWFIIWFLVWVILCYSYNTLFVKKSNNFRQWNMMRNWSWSMNFGIQKRWTLDKTQYKKIEK